jgi:hypothetical protein
MQQAIAAAELRYGCKHSGSRISPNGTVWHQFGPFTVSEARLLELAAI